MQFIVILVLFYCCYYCIFTLFPKIDLFFSRQNKYHNSHHNEQILMCMENGAEKEKQKLKFRYYKINPGIYSVSWIFPEENIGPFPV